MEQYPSIDRYVRNIPVYAYDKLDGSNVRAEWTRKNGWYKYGSRNQLIDETHPFLGEAIPLFTEKYADDLDKIFRKNRLEKTVVFFEFFGENSFAGWHESDEPHDVVLFDCHVYKQGLIPPKEFNRMFESVETAPLLYSGNCNNDFVTQVQQGELPGMTFEGVVCKGGFDSRRRLQVFKIKNQAWLDKLKTKCGSDEALYRKLV